MKVNRKSTFCIARLDPGSMLLPDTPCFLADVNEFCKRIIKVSRLATEE